MVKPPDKPAKPECREATAAGAAKPAVSTSVLSARATAGRPVPFYDVHELRRLQLAPAPKVSSSVPPTEEITDISTTADLGRLVREVRKQRGLSQQAFAEAAGVGRRFVSELENGKATIELGKALLVARACGIDLSARRRA